MKRAVLVVWALLVAVGPGDAAEIRASTAPEYARLDTILTVTLLNDTEREVAIRIFETGGGDPAINGDHILLTITPPDYEEQPSRTWETGINMNTVGKVTHKGTSILIVGTEQYIDDAGKVRTVPASFRVKYLMRDGKLGDRIEVLRESGRPEPADG